MRSMLLRFMLAVVLTVVCASAAGPVVTEVARDPRGFPLFGAVVGRDGTVYVSGQLVGIASVNVEDGTLTRLAGGGTDLSDGISASNAHLAGPGRMVLDPAGNLVLSDGHRVRRIDLTTGIITTIAGTGSEGFSGDGGSATDAKLHAPRGLAFDDQGNLFIADSDNHRVRRVEASTGIITTVAGAWMKGYEGSIGSPSDVAIAPDGSLLVASPELARVLRVEVSGSVSTFAGNGASYGWRATGDGGTPALATLCAPVSLEFNSRGHLFINDGTAPSNLPNIGRCIGAVRRVDGKTGVIQTFAANGWGPALLPNGKPLDGRIVNPTDIAAADNELYFTTSNGVLYKISDADVAPQVESPDVMLVMDTAAFQPSRLPYPGIGFSPGELISIMGNYLGPAAPLPATVNAQGRIATELSGVRLLFFDEGAHPLPAPLLFVSAGRVDAIVPYGVPTPRRIRQRMLLEIGSRQAEIEYSTAAASPNVYPDLVINPDGSVNSADNPAPQGAVLVMYGTGFGPTNPPGIDGTVSSPPDLPLPAGDVSVHINTSSGKAEIGTLLYAGQAPSVVAGVIQLNIKLPLNLPAKNLVFFRVNGECPINCSGAMVYVEQASTPPLITDVALLDGGTAWGNRMLLVKGSGFETDAVLELYLNGRKVATLAREGTPFESSSEFHTRLNLGGVPGTYEVSVRNAPNVTSPRRLVPGIDRTGLP